jgi:dephospho-CoA kinase
LADLRPLTPTATAPVVALIGPVGAGKSAVREALTRRGAMAVDFDDYSRELLRPGTPEYELLRREFGPGVFQPDGSVDRRALGALVFAEPQARERLNALLHPAMLARLRAALADFRAQATARMLVVEGAILAQLPTSGWFDRVVLVTAPAALRVQRLHEGRRLSSETAEALVRLHEGMSLGQEKADYTLVNDGDREALEVQVGRLWRELVGDG